MSSLLASIQLSVFIRTNTFSMTIAGGKPRQLDLANMILERR